MNSTAPEAHIWDDFDTSTIGLTALIGTLTIATVSYAARSLLHSSKADTIARLNTVPIIGTWGFFTKRFDFVRDGFKRVGQPLFSFSLLGHQIVALSGTEGRTEFFNNRDLNFTEGYRLLMGGAPSTKEVQPAEHAETDDLSWFAKRLVMLLRKDRVAELLPTLLGDLDTKMKKWPAEGMMNPFKDIYDLVFQLTLRAATCHEIADDPEMVDKIAKLYWQVEKGTTPIGLLFPWLPTSAKKRKTAAATELYTIFSNAIEERRKTKGQDSDAMQVLVDMDDATPDIVGFCFGTLFAGVINTGINACWLLMFLTTYPEWKAKAQAEIASFISKHSVSSTGSLAERLAGVPPSAWEDEMPVMDVCIRETLRLILSGAALRRNILKDITVGGKTVPRGAFMTYLVADAHFNPDIYPEPHKYDPGRYAPGREEDKKETFAYLGWGVGRHPCLGMRFAKIELKVIAALFLGGYEYELVDAHGNPPSTFPQPDRNDIYQSRPLGEPTFLKYKRVVE